MGNKGSTGGRSSKVSRFNDKTDKNNVASAAIETNNEAPSKEVGNHPNQSTTPIPMSDSFRYEKNVCALEFWEPVKLLEEGSISDIHLVRRRCRRIHVRYKNKRDVMDFAKHNSQRVPKEDLYVLKSIMKDHVGEERVLQEMRSELKTMSNLKHPNIVKLHEAYERRRHIYLIMEYCSGGNLAQRQQQRPYTEAQAVAVVSQILSAVAYLHERNVVHRDLKLENIMFDAKGVVKIIDFGLATKYLSDDYKVMTDRVGTLYSMAPQVLQGVYTSKCDLWSIGVITYVLLCGHYPFWGPPRSMPWSKRRKIMIDRIMRGKYMRMEGPSWGGVSQEAKDFCVSLLQMDPNRRPTAKQALRSRWIVNSQKQNVQQKETPILNPEYQVHLQIKRAVKEILEKELTRQEILDLRGVLEDYDMAGEGYVQWKDFRRSLEESTRLSSEDISRIFDANEQQVDPNTPTEYIDFVIQVMQDIGRHAIEDVAKALDELDVDETRRVPKSKVLAIIDQTINIGQDDVLNSLLDGVAVDSDGKVSTVQVLEALGKKNAKQLRNSIRSMHEEDEEDDGLVSEMDAVIPGGRKNLVQ